MELQPPKSTGLAFGLGALLVWLALAAGSLALIVTRPLDPLSAALAALLTASAPLAVWLAYRGAGLLSARYRLTRNSLTVDWGGRREVIPLTEIEEAHSASEYAGTLRPPAWRWPGCVVGRVQQADLGAVEFLAVTAEKSRLVLLGYPGGWLALSPANPAAFLTALAERRAEGVEEPVEAETVLPELPQWALWQDRLALGLILAGAVALLALLGYFTLISPQLPAEMALRFDARGQPIRFGQPTGLITLVLIGAVAWGLNTAGGIWLHRRPADRALAYVLFGATVLVQALVWAAAVGLLTAGRST